MVKKTHSKSIKTSPRILVTGGAGYIGSITSKKLQEAGFEVVILDNLERGNREVIDLLQTPFLEVDLRDYASLRAKLAGEKIDAVIHFAAYALAGESMEKPHLYFENNILGTLNLLRVMEEQGIKKLVFSSSCAIYGTPQQLPVDESAPENPESVYAETKRIGEKLIQWYCRTRGFQALALRYFNASGALLDGSMGQFQDPFSHIIPRAIMAALQGEKFTIFGDDYPTPDGTCIRDYIHVEDLAQAHRAGLEKLLRSTKPFFDYYNLGVGKGYSNKEIVAMIREVSGLDFSVEIGPRRPGDPAIIYGDNQKACRELNWEPRYSLREIVASAYRWHREHPRGYSSSLLPKQ